jgi:hypothetical protein
LVHGLRYLRLIKIEEGVAAVPLQFVPLQFFPCNSNTSPVGAGFASLLQGEASY